MDYRELGRTNLRVSALGFGCGNVGGLMIRGTRAERERAVARALDLGVNFFDTAPLYGDGRARYAMPSRISRRFFTSAPPPRSRSRATRRARW